MPILQPGYVIRDTYEVERFLGEGAFAEVYRVKHLFLGRQALKIFKIPDSSIQNIHKKLHEARLLSGLKHPNIIEVFDANKICIDKFEYGYFTMAYMPGGTLEEYWRSFGERLMPVYDVVTIIKQICSGLAVAHISSPPIIHRDIKPQNILIEYNQSEIHVRLSDFGLAKSVNALTLLASAKGTMGFKPPEALEDIDSCRADIWAVGTLFYLLLTDHMPYPELNDRQIQNVHNNLGTYRLPSFFNAAVDSVLEKIISKALSTFPLDRYANAQELLDALNEWSPLLDQDKKTAFSRSSFKADPNITQMRKDGEKLVAQAFLKAKDSDNLDEAADLLEEGISKNPLLREKYAYQLSLWRKGVMHVSIVQFEKK